jgi:transposase-like protein
MHVPGYIIDRFNNYSLVEKALFCFKP